MASRIQRRSMLLALSGVGLGVGCSRPESAQKTAPEPTADGAEKKPAPSARPGRASPSGGRVVVSSFALDFQWKTFDPFLFCVHHSDEYPLGNEAMGPLASLDGRNLGSDFEGKDGWRMYHGSSVPGFPRHPHRGFETVTVTRSGFIDHSDSLGATARYGQGDVQWMTAGRGIVHAEMFPLLERQQKNHTELFQIWLNLPRRDKFVAPHFSMFWKDAVPEPEVADANGKKTSVRIIAGSFSGARAPAPPPNSWASHADSDLAIWSLRMQPGAIFTLPETAATTERTLYFFRGDELGIGEQRVAVKRGLQLRPGAAVRLEAGSVETELLLLQARPIGEPVARRGPFVMNEPDEIRQAYVDYRNTQFGGWPWQNDDPVHARQQGRFAIHADGREERAL